MRIPVPAFRGLVQALLGGLTAPRVEDSDGVRKLRFDGLAVQSAMRLDAPFALELGYTRAMTGFLLFRPEPRQIIVVGLGGGSLPKFCHRALPETHLTVVEINPQVIALRDQFLIPPDGGRFRVVEADASEYFAREAVAADVVLVDGYDRWGLPEPLCTEQFYRDCRRALNPGGVLVVNLWGQEPNRARYLRRLIRVFDGQVWWSRPRESTCLIAYALNGGGRPSWSRMIGRARALDKRHHLDLVHAVLQMRARQDPDG